MKPIEYYMDLNYGIEIRNIPKEDGGGVKACIPRLGRFAAVGHGNDVLTALRDLEDSKKELLEYHIEKGIPIPEPDDELENLKSYSGRFLLRNHLRTPSPIGRGRKSQQINPESVLRDSFGQQLFA